MRNAIQISKPRYTKVRDDEGLRRTDTEAEGRTTSTQTYAGPSFATSTSTAVSERTTSLFLAAEEGDKGGLVADDDSRARRLTAYFHTFSPDHGVVAGQDARDEDPEPRPLTVPLLDEEEEEGVPGDITARISV